MSLQTGPGLDQRLGTSLGRGSKLLCSSAPWVPSTAQALLGPGACTDLENCWVWQQGALWERWLEMFRASIFQHHCCLLGTHLHGFGAFNPTIRQRENWACWRCDPDTVGRGSSWTSPGVMLSSGLPWAIRQLPPFPWAWGNFLLCSWHFPCPSARAGSWCWGLVVRAVSGRRWHLESCGRASEKLTLFICLPKPSF